MVAGILLRLILLSCFFLPCIGRLGLPESGIPGNAAVSLTVHLVEVSPAPEITALSLEDRFRMGRRKKEMGNFWYSRENHTPAIQCYR